MLEDTRRKKADFPANRFNDGFLNRSIIRVVNKYTEIILKNRAVDSVVPAGVKELLSKTPI